MNHPFTNNKYTMWYFSIINNARSREKNIDYVERHHIVPRSLGGTNKKENLVTLTAREHFICHRLLVKMTCNGDRVKMAYAMRCMMNLENEHQVRYKINSSTYEMLKTETSKILSGRLSGANNPYYGKRHSTEIKIKMSELRQERIQSGRVEGMFGKHHSDTTKEKLREANRKQFEDPIQIEIRRTKCNKIQGMKIYHNNLGQTKYYFENTQPSGWILGRPKKKGGVA